MGASRVRGNGGLYWADRKDSLREGTAPHPALAALGPPSPRLRREREHAECDWSSITNECASAASRSAAAGVAFEARAVANEREVAAFAAGLAVVALGLGFGALLRRQRARARTRVGNLAAGDDELVLLELLGGRELLLGLGLERGGAFGARLAAAEGRDLAAAGRAPRATLPADGGG